jgi:leishmanolysin-like peptidase
MTPTLSAFLTTSLVPAAVSRWSGLLSTIPVQGSLYASRFCDSNWPTGSPWPCASFADTTDCGNNAHDELIFFNSTFLGADVNYTAPPGLTPVTQPAGAGLPDADYGLFVTAKQTPRCGSGGTGVLAYALTCQRDQYDRPTWGRVNFCPRNLDVTADRWAAQLGVAVHELAHALGFSSQSWYLFRDTDAARTPRTARDSRFPDTPAAAHKITYSCNTFSYTAYMPNANTVDYFAERGMSCSLPNNMPPYKATSDCVHRITTPAAVAAARDFFDCPTLPGPELENQLTTQCDLQGSHWEQRVLSTELMSSYTQHVMRVSPITLAVFEDSGWYVANYSGADAWRTGADWGYRQGCAFARDSKCLDGAGNGLGTPPHFYSVNHAAGSTGGNSLCTTDREAVAYTSVATYSNALPAQFQYFSGQPTVGGADPNTFDYCPAVQAYSNRICRLVNDTFTGADIFGEVYGTGSMCFASTLRKQGYQTTGNGAGCYQQRCDTSSTPAVVVVRVDGSDYTCGAAGSTVTVPGFNGQLTCPDAAIVCSPPTTYQPGGGANRTLPPLPSASSTPGPTSSPTPTSSPRAYVVTYKFVFPNLNLSYALGLKSDGSATVLPGGSSPFLAALVAEVCAATGTCASAGGYAQLLYPYDVTDTTAGKTAVLVFDAATGGAYLTRYDTVTPTTPSSQSVTVTLGYRVVQAAPSPDAGAAANVANEPVDITVINGRYATMDGRLGAASGTQAAALASFPLTRAAYCGGVRPVPLTGFVCDAAFVAALQSYPSTVILRDANTGSRMSFSGGSGSGASGGSNSAAAAAWSTRIAAIAGGVAGALVALVVVGIAAYYCCCKGARAPPATGGGGGPGGAHPPGPGGKGGAHAGGQGPSLVVNRGAAPTAAVLSSLSAGPSGGGGGREGGFGYQHPQQQYAQQQYYAQQQQQFSGGASTGNPSAPLGRGQPAPRGSYGPQTRVLA